MNKEAPSIGRVGAMVGFALSCFGLLIYLWLSFGGPVPLSAQGYRFEVAIPEAATLAEEADVRIAGINVGKVRSKSLEESGERTIVEVEIDERYAPIPRDSRAILRQKTLLGETYLQLSTGDRESGMLEDGDRLDPAQVEPTVELDEIFTAFDEDTRQAFRDWVAELTTAIEDGRGEDLNDAFGNLEGFAVDGADLLGVLDRQETALRRLVRNTGVVFGAINERENALRELIVNSGNTFEATAAEDEALAETFEVFPTFLDESRLTLARLEDFARETRPLVNDLKGPADDLGPTVRDLGDLAPDLDRLFRDLPPLVRASRTGLPDLQRVLDGAGPVLDAIHPFLQELNPILSYANFQQGIIANFMMVGAANLSSKPGGDRTQSQIGVIEPRSFTKFFTQPDWERGNAYIHPRAANRAYPLGIMESFDCAPSGGERPEPDDATGTPGPLQAPERRSPCFVQPRSLYDNRQFTIPQRGRSPRVDAPGGLQGSEPATP